MVGKHSNQNRSSSCQEARHFANSSLFKTPSWCSCCGFNLSQVAHIQFTRQVVSGVRQSVVNQQFTFALPLRQWKLLLMSQNNSASSVANPVDSNGLIGQADRRERVPNDNR